MISQLSDEAIELGRVACEALADAGGVELLRTGIDGPSGRAEVVDKALAPLGVWELDVTEEPIAFEAAASVACAAGRHGIPYPVSERLARIPGSDALLLVEGAGRNRAPHADLDLQWTAVDLRGNQFEVVNRETATLGTRLGNFVAEFDAKPVTGAPGTAREAAARLVTLQSWYLLGLLDRCLENTTQYMREREQFGRRLVDYQALGFTLAELNVAMHKFEELAKYALWSQWTSSDPAVALIDALALRLTGLESADVVLRGTHQLHGAMGFCDETDVSLLSRLSQGVRRLPVGAERTAQLLTDQVLVHGMASPFADAGDLL
jgi:hypothetical protein